MAKSEEKQWTLMFYFASDNPLAPGIVSQLKSIKQAGFHHDVNVIAQFDPQPEGTPTHIFDVNRIRRLSADKPQIGFIGINCQDPFVSTLLEDKLWRGEKEPQLDRDGNLIRKRIIESLENEKLHDDPPEPPLDRKIAKPIKAAGANKSNGRTRELNPKESLKAFLKFCRQSYPAKHYMLFILGHGVVVGNDVFLFDENPDTQSLSLQDLGALLNNFKQKLENGAELELVSFHSCSVSSLEVAYELLDSKLQGTANYMLASQGPAFIGSWPYRQILMSTFNNVDYLKSLETEGKIKEAKKHVKELLQKIFGYCYYNSTDFLLAGYSFDLCLCNLNKVADITAPLSDLSKALIDGLNHRDGLTNSKGVIDSKGLTYREGVTDSEGMTEEDNLSKEDNLFKDLIVLAHWEAQSHWQENYTDLHDFCFCLRRQCETFLKRLGASGEGLPGQKPAEMQAAIEGLLGEKQTKLQAIIKACDVVMAKLEKETGGKEQIIIKSEFAGPGHQYSHGLSVFFPWSRPVSDRPILEEYAQYKLNQTMKAKYDTSWLTFLERYFDQSQRNPQKTEVKNEIDKAIKEGLMEALPPRTAKQKAKDEENEFAEDLLSLVFNGEGQLSRETSPADVLKVGSRDPTGDDCTCGSIKNYPRDTRARRDRERGKPDKKEKPAPVPISQPSSNGFTAILPSASLKSAS